MSDDPGETSDTGDERTTLLDYLGVQRAMFERKCTGLTPEQLATRSVPPSSLSLLGLLRHLAKVEQVWFRHVMDGQEGPRRYSTAAEPDADFDGAVADPDVVAEAWAAWREEVAFAEAWMADHHDLDVTGLHHGQPVNLRSVLVHLVEEYARHLGHADLLRERIDGRTGD